MATTRDFKSLGVYASDAETTIPVTPSPGTAYRNVLVTDVQNETGEAYDLIPNSIDWNQKFYIISSFTDLIDKHGIPGWSEDVDYTLPAIVWASDNIFYEALQPSGPSTTVRDPVSESTYWSPITAADLEAKLADKGAGTEGALLVGTTGETVQAKLVSLDSGLTTVTNELFDYQSDIADKGVGTEGALLVGTTGETVQAKLEEINKIIPKAFGVYTFTGGVYVLQANSYNLGAGTKTAVGQITVQLNYDIQTFPTCQITRYDNSSNDLYGGQYTFDSALNQILVEIRKDNGNLNDEGFAITVHEYM